MLILLYKTELSQLMFRLKKKTNHKSKRISRDLFFPLLEVKFPLVAARPEHGWRMGPLVCRGGLITWLAAGIYAETHSINQQRQPPPAGTHLEVQYLSFSNSS